MHTARCVVHSHNEQNVNTFVVELWKAEELDFVRTRFRIHYHNHYLNNHLRKIVFNIQNFSVVFDMIVLMIVGCIRNCQMFL